jgi:hypothetical protein
MTCTPTDQAPASLEEAAERALCWTEHSLANGDRRVLDAVWWLSTHLAASDKVLHRELWRSATHRPEVRAQRLRAREIEDLLWTVDHRLTGDSRVSAGPVQPLVAELLGRAREYADTERSLLGELTAQVGDERRRELAARYLRAVRRAPTRPHPLMQRMRRLNYVLFRLEGATDHVRDVLDSRHVPQLAPRRPRTAGRWDHYVVGSPSWTGDVVVTRGGQG